MKTKALFSAALLGSFISSSVFAVGDASLYSYTHVAVEVGNGTDLGGDVTLPNAMIGELIETLSVQIGTSLVFPDLVIPATGADANTVEISLSGESQLVTYSAGGNPRGANTNANSHSNIDTAARLGQLIIRGHGNKNIGYTIASSGTKTQATDGYTVTSTGALTDDGAQLSNGEKTVGFGGILTVYDNAVVGTVSESLDVTVNYK